MKIEREKLLASLRKLKPAIGDKSPIEGLNHVWLNGATAMAYNDVVGIETPCNVPLEGGLYGGTILGLLEKSSAKDIEIEGGGKEAVLKFVGARAKLPILAVEHAVNPFVEVDSDGMVIDAEFIKALGHVMTSVADSGTYAGEGVTLSTEDDMLALYATDGLTVSWARIPLPAGQQQAVRLALSADFCKQVLVLCKEGGSLHLFDDQALAVAMDGTRIMGRLPQLTVDRPFAEIIAENLPADAEPTHIPEKLASVIDRALVLSQGREAKVTATIDGPIMRFVLKTALGELHEAVTLKPPIPPKISALFNPVLVERGIKKSLVFVLNAQAFVMLGEGDYGFMCATPTG